MDKSSFQEESKRMAIWNSDVTKPQHEIAIDVNFERFSHVFPNIDVFIVE